MTRERTFHAIAISLLVLGILVGAACWLLKGTVFWVMGGLAALLIVVGLVFASRASALERSRKEEQETKGGGQKPPEARGRKK